MKIPTLVVVALVVAAASATTVAAWEQPGRLRSVTSPAGAGLCDATVKQESGYYSIGNANKNYFYWYFESRNDPANDPLVIWMTGGPGCSSMLALLGENGPCSVPDDAGTTTVNNPYSWTSKANVLWVDQPADVGFSYGDSTDHDEVGVAADMYAFVQALLTAHPELQKTPLFISGESYGGHYAPAVAAALLKGNQVAEEGTLHVPLAGLTVGNGLTQPSVQYAYYADMAYNYSMTKVGKPRVTLPQYEQMIGEMPACLKEIGECQSDSGECDQAQSDCNAAQMAPYQSGGWNPYDIRKQCGPNPLCYDFTGLTTWLNNASVQTALGVKSGTKWQSCNFVVNMGFSADWMKDYEQDVKALLEAGLPVLIYAGDCDFVCNWLGNQAWSLQLDWSGKDAFNKADFHEWDAAGGAAGQARSASGATKGGTLTFLRVYDAGHMVPMDKPPQALAMLETFTSGGSF